MDLVDNLVWNTIDTLCICGTTNVNAFYITYTLFNRAHPNGVLLTSSNVNLIVVPISLIFIIHGWMESGASDWIPSMKRFYLSARDVNVVVVDWSRYSRNAAYIPSACAVQDVGVFVGRLLYEISINPGINLDTTQLVGFSLGAQISGVAGQEVLRLSGRPVGMIVGLDPAGPCFVGKPLNRRLDPSDGTVVEVMHCDAGKAGYRDPCGTADFYVQYYWLLGCGTEQPGCTASDLCNHGRCCDYFNESIATRNFVAWKCNSCSRFGNGACKHSPTTIMGENMPSTASGVYYLNVNSQPPYAQGG